MSTSSTNAAITTLCPNTSPLMSQTNVSHLHHLIVLLFNFVSFTTNYLVLKIIRLCNYVMWKFHTKAQTLTLLRSQMVPVVRRLFLMREVWGSNPEPIESPTRCQRLVTAATLKCGPWCKATEKAPLTCDTGKGIIKIYLVKFYLKRLLSIDFLDLL